MNYLKSIRTTRFWLRLGQPNTIGLPIFVVSLAFTALLSFAFDAVRLQNINFIWIPINATAIAMVLLVAVPAVVIKRKMNPKGHNQQIFNIAIMSLCFATKNLLMIYVAESFGVPDDANPYVRFIGGIFLGLGILIIYTNVVGSRLMREASLAELRANESKLRAYRDAAVSQLEQESSLAATRTLNTLSPQLEELVRRAEKSEDILSLVNKLINYIKNELKPFSAALTAEATSLRSQVEAYSMQSAKEPEAKIQAPKLIRVSISLLPVPFLFYLVSSFAIPNVTGMDILTASVIFTLSLTFFKIMVKNFPDLSTNQAFTVTTGVALLSSLPSFYLFSQVPNQAGVPELLPAFYIVPALSVIAASQAYILDQRFSHTEDLLKSVVQELARENKIYQQKAWLASHSWYLLLHGLVQPALTAAAMRANESKDNIGQTNSLILSDLQRALNSLKQPLGKGQSVGASMSDVQSAWEDICSITYDVDQDVIDRTSGDEISMQVINEVLKEIVSNAVRHGNASNVAVTISLEGAGAIRVLASNDGTKPTDSNSESVGSRMLEAFCLERSLLWNNETKKTEFKALIPIKI